MELVAGNMTMKISIQNKGGKEVVKGGLEVSSEVSFEIACHDDRSHFPLLVHVCSPQD